MTLDTFYKLITHHMLQNPDVEVLVDLGHFEAPVVGVGLRAKPYPDIRVAVPDRLVIKLGVNRVASDPLSATALDETCTDPDCGAAKLDGHTHPGENE